MKHGTSSTRYLAVLLLAMLALAGGAIALPHDPYIRWQSFKGTMFERTKHQYERLHFDAAPVDVLFVGSSRTAAAVEPELLQRALAKEGQRLRVADLSLPASGMDIRVTQVREALAAKPEIKLIVFAVVEALPRDGHQAFGDLARTSEILTSPWMINRSLPASILRLPMRQMKLSAASAFPAALGYQGEFSPATYRGSDFDFREGTARPAQYDFTSAAHRAALEEESAYRKQQITPPVLPDALSDMEFGVSRGSIEQVQALAQANGAKVVFLFLPFYKGYSEPLDADWLKQRAPLWSPTWMMQEPRYYVDAAHSSPLVRERLNRWLAQRIARCLGAADCEER